MFGVSSWVEIELHDSSWPGSPTFTDRLLWSNVKEYNEAERYSILFLLQSGNWKKMRLSQVKICRPPIPLSFAPIFMKDAQCWIEWKNNFPILFFELSWKFIENCGEDVTKMTITRKIRIRKIWNLIFLSIQPIPDLHVNSKKFFFQFYFSSYRENSSKIGVMTSQIWP